MGYRTYLWSIPKEVYEDWKDKTKEQAFIDAPELFDTDDDEPYFVDHNFLKKYGKELYAFGKYNDHDTGHKDALPNLVDTSDGEFSIVTKDLLLSIIDEYRQHTFEYYTKLSSGELDRFEGGVEKFLKEKIALWSEENHYKPYNTSLEKDDIVDSWNYEYAVFELVRLYKIIDPEKEALIYMGY